ncbi:NAD-dependent epimerase/dehydratase family protein [Chloroflexota bacterium]
MSKNLIIGGFGYLGCHLARQLLKQGEEVAVFDIVPPQRTAADIASRIDSFRGELTDWPQVLEVVSKVRPDTVFHLAALLPPVSEEKLHISFRVNVEGTVNVLEAVRLTGTGCMIFTSTMGIYGPPLPEAIDDDYPQRPQNMYGATKVCCEQLGERYNRLHNLNFRAVRFPPVVGPGRTGQTPVPSIFSCFAIEAAARQEPYKLNVAPETTMPYLYTKDAIKALIGLRDASEEKLGQRVYSIHGSTASAAELIQAIKKQVPEAQLDYDPDENVVKIVNGFPHRLDDSPARKDWGWKPSYDIDGLVKDFIAEFRAHPDLYPSGKSPSYLRRG